MVCDRSLWPPGPWDDEPFDTRQWVDQTTGYPCAMHRGSVGSWCGYVAVPTHHRAHGRDYYEVMAWIEPNDPHGGLTFAGFMDHIGPLEPDTQGAWWFGFDCAHAGDRAPGLEAVGLNLPLRLLHGGDPHYWTADEVETETAALAVELARLDDRR